MTRFLLVAGKQEFEGVVLGELRTEVPVRHLSLVSSSITVVCVGYGTMCQVGCSMYMQEHVPSGI